MHGKRFQKFLLGLSLAVLVACQQETSSQKADMVVFNGSDAISLAFNGNQLTKLGEVAKIPDGKAPRWDYIEEGKTALYGKTTEDNSPGFPLLYRYDKAEHTIKTLDDGDTYTMTFDGDFLYRTDIYTDKVVFYKYDADLKELGKKEFPTEASLEITNDILAIDDKLYVLIGSVDKENSQHTNRLWILDKELNKLEEVDIDYTSENRGGFLRMVSAGDTLFIAEPSRGRSEDGEPGPGQYMVSYKLETKALGQIQLETPYPHDVFYDKERNVLVIGHNSLYVEGVPWTFIDLDDDQQRTISLGEGFDQYASFTQHEGEYYFLFENKLVKYNYDQDEKTVYDLGALGIDSASVLVFEP